MKMREKMARALCKARGIDPDRQGHDGWPPYWPHVLPEVDAMLDALMEPTEGMIEANKSVDHLEPDLPDVLGEWKAMITAAKEGK
ncbi:hypothetical protein [Devosia sp.]|uniref:hypothetical protein n=1 Tax=Devosia sp. TaxID=1871048 RepID=UPI001B21EBCC|nr:hypothetical protein [Devosia sp.]MBO9589587.1 hypothetical protein [Devosia sp.]